MSQPESALSRKIMAALRAKGYFAFKVHGNEHMMTGLPDVIVCAEGLFIGLETKMPQGKKPTERQKYVHMKIRQADGTAVVVRSVREALRVVKETIDAHYE